MYRLAKALVVVRDLPGLSDSRVDKLVELWHTLPEPDKRHQERLVRVQGNEERQVSRRDREGVPSTVRFFFVLVLCVTSAFYRSNLHG